MFAAADAEKGALVSILSPADPDASFAAASYALEIAEIPKQVTNNSNKDSVRK